MHRRRFVLGLFAAALTPFVLLRLSAGATGAGNNKIEKIRKTEDEWRAILTEKEFHILREEGTERRGSSELNNEKRDGTYVCAGCELLLFKSEWKYNSGTGWPSFWDVMHDHIGTKEDNSWFTTRTEYHCARCGGHQGHVFADGPQPTGQRWCNNGAALNFVPA